METAKNITLGIIHGLWDSIRGMSLILYIDDELQAEQEAAKQQKLLERERLQRGRRTPSPCPSSASEMIREQIAEQKAQRQRELNDERTIQSIRKRANPTGVELPKSEKKVAKQVLKCCLLNGGFTWLSIVLFEQLLLPTLKFVLTLCYGQQSEMLAFIWSWLQPILTIIFGMMWVLPIFLLSKIVSSLWFADIANAAYKVRKGTPQLIPSPSKLIADFLFSLLIQALFLVQSMLVNMLPIKYVGSSLCFVHLCLLYSLYSFEYKWFNNGWELHRRLNYIEFNWPYFLGFGIPLTVATNLSSSMIVSSCIFSILFPLFILSGNEAKPLVGATDTPLRLFSPTIFVSNMFFKGSGSRRTLSSTKQAQQQQLLKQQQLQQQQLRYEKLQRQREREQIQMAAAVKSQMRYAQQTSTAGASPARTSKSTESHSVPYYGTGMRPLIPTPVPGAPTSAAAGH